MPPTSLRATLDSLANNFASAILEAIRSASLEQLLAESGAGRSSNGLRAKAAGGGGQPDPLKTPGHKVSGRLARRSPEEIAKTLGSIVSLLKGKKAGMRSEEIRKALKLDVREVPRVLKEGLSSKKLKSKGQKRATVYTAA
jgi:hypothetical protein